MTTTDIDPHASCDRATRALQNNLIEEGQRLADSGHFQEAIDTLFHAYSLRPGTSPVLHDIHKLYTALGDNESATACRRGVIPEAAELKYFNANLGKKRLVAARKASKCRHINIKRAEKIKLSRPNSNQNPALRPEFRAVNTESRGNFVSVLESADFWFDGFNTVIMDCNENILQEHVKGNSHVVADITRRRAKRSLDGVVCFLDARSSAIYYHWMMDVLPKFALLEQAGICLQTIDHFVVRCNSAFQRQTLALLGVPLDKIIRPSPDTLTHCENLIVPYLKHDRGDRFYNGLGLGMASWVPQWMKLTFLSGNRQVNTDQLRNSPEYFSKRLYISRSERGTRAPVDEERLVKELKNRGFSCVSMETMNVTEQANLMAHADWVIAPHGAGLTNITFCKPGTVVLEIFGEYVVPCYWALSELCHFDYHAYFGSSKDSSKQTKQSIGPEITSLSERRDKQIELDISNLLQYIDTLDTSTVQASR